MLREISAEIETKDSLVWAGVSSLQGQGCEADSECWLCGVTAGGISSSYLRLRDYSLAVHTQMMTTSAESTFRTHIIHIHSV